MQSAKLAQEEALDDLRLVAAAATFIQPSIALRYHARYRLTPFRLLRESEVSLGIIDIGAG